MLFNFVSKHQKIKNNTIYVTGVTIGIFDFFIHGNIPKKYSCVLFYFSSLFKYLIRARVRIYACMRV